MTSTDTANPTLPCRSALRLLSTLAFLVLLSDCAMLAPAPPENQSNICEIFREQPDWYDYARASEEKWGTPVATQMAFIERESSFRSHVKPPRGKLLGFIPWKRPSSAYGYAQAQDPVWEEYEDEAGRLFARRSHMKHATDFIGWYNARTQRMTGVSLHNPEHLYLAYHEGQGGYRRGSWRGKPGVQRAARQVAANASRYRNQLAACEAEFRCDGLLEVWPFCR
ncbi:MAG: lysozyme-like domain containing protein [Halomonas sp.]|uniref:transglycosylase SLT domain-containing protein n=1 Tax=Halomonas sp. TaxID=1486246 RepID=UPI002ACED12C|nr:lysozyme-like domain containing protein [Halomonas sp.]MDZ7853043.1 lysozyme-like domain containing protein [Halomonas sp.]